MVSGATGFLDFLSYMAASVSSTVFAGAVDGIGWSGLVLVWGGLVALGIVVALPWGKILRRPNSAW
jgi:sugar phosphate permease